MKHSFSHCLNEVDGVDLVECGWLRLPLTLMLIPLNGLLKQSSDGNSLSYLKARKTQQMLWFVPRDLTAELMFRQEAIHCVFSGEADACGPEAKHGELAGICVLVYVLFNLAWNMGILLSVKHTGALATFVALKAIFPVTWEEVGFWEPTSTGRDDPRWVGRMEVR